MRFLLKQQLQCELNLARGAEISNREPRAEDFAERGAGYRVSRVAEVGVVEKVKRFGPELQIKPLRYLRVLGYRKICIHEVGLGKRVTPRTTGMAASRDYRIGLVPGRSRSRVIRNVAERTRNCERSIRRCSTVGDRRRCPLQRFGNKRLAQDGVAVELVVAARA